MDLGKKFDILKKGVLELKNKRYISNLYKKQASIMKIVEGPEEAKINNVKQGAAYHL